MIAHCHFIAKHRHLGILKYYFLSLAGEQDEQKNEGADSSVFR
jgi:hypothetical protein